MRTYHFKACTIKVSLSLWDKHAVMPPMRLAVCFDGWVTIWDHIPTFYPRALSPPPHYHIHCSSFLMPFYLPPKICLLQILFIIHLRPHNYINSTQIFALPFPFLILPQTFPSTALRSETRLNSRIWIFLRYQFYLIIIIMSHFFCFHCSKYTELLFQDSWIV